MDVRKIEKDYQNALDYLYSFVDYSLTRSFRYSAEKFNLDRMVQLLEIVGNPHQDYPIIHIAGTKGKGSTAAYCAQVLQYAGYKVGMYTSPHLEDYCERIQVNRISISHEKMVDLVNSIKEAVSCVPKLTTFEITTAMGFLHFSKQDVDIVVAEVGLGGRLDATNVVKPIVSVITSISLDHTNILGNSLREIAGEKCGIIKSGIPVVSSPQKPEALQVIMETANSLGSHLTLVGRDILVKPIRHDLEGQSALIWNVEEQHRMDSYLHNQPTNGWEPVKLDIPLLGSHQMENAVTAFTTLSICHNAGFMLTKEAINNGFRTVQWPARFEIINRDPLVIIDSAHNQDSARRLRQTIEDYLPGRKIKLIFGASEDKDIEKILKELLPGIDIVYATKSEHPRALDPDAIVKQVEKFGKAAIEFDNVEAALRQACMDSDASNVVIATGSIFIAAAVRGLVRKLNKEVIT
jgi:dihydrofolate synthase/folylpolyglutamate synthase